MANNLERGARVENRGLCSFCVKEYPGYIGRNPKIGATVEVAPKKLPLVLGVGYVIYWLVKRGVIRRGTSIRLNISK